MIFSTPEFVDDTINYKVGSVYQDTEIQKHSSNILNYMFNKLDNNRIRLNVIVEADESIKELKPYTASEKFAAMTNKNSSLILLKQMLNLELE